MDVTHGGSGSSKKREAQNCSQARCVWKHLQEANSSVAAWLNSMDVTLGGSSLIIEAQALATEGFADM